MKAVWKGRVLAESDATRVVEGNHYFPPESLVREHFEDSTTHTTCSWKGVASYKTVVVDGERNADAAWYYAAGERVEVAVLRTLDESGAPHDTKLWIVDHDGAPWVRVARPERQWFERLRRHPEIELVRQGAPPQRVLAKPDASPEARAALDAAFRAKYGATDWWYGVLLRRAPVPIRLERVSP